MDYRVRIEEDNDFSSPVFTIIFYVLAFSILLPIGVCWLLYKLIKWIIDKRSGKSDSAYDTPVGFNNAYYNLLSLHKLKTDGFINKEEFSKKRDKLVKCLSCHGASISIVEDQLHKLHELYELQILTEEEYEKKRSKLVKKMR